MRTARVKDDRCLRREGEYDDEDDDVPHLTLEDRVLMLMLSMLLRQKRCCPPFFDDDTRSLNAPKRYMPTDTRPQKKPQKAKGSHKPTEMAAMAVQRHSLLLSSP